MKFTILSHAGLYVEHEGVSVLVDPWLIGSCYWRSWWNFPEPDKALLDSLKPDYIYLTHLHWDHFHGPSLRLFDKQTKILVPLVNTLRMVKDLHALGFKNIEEISHGTGVNLGKDFEIYSYQYGTIVDSAVVLTDGKTNIFNFNDCKFFGIPLRQIIQRFKKVDFALRSYSSASPIPYCVEGYENKFKHLRTRQDYIEEFSNFAIHVGAKYAIPFASNHCFLHKETACFNDTSVSPESACGYLNAKAESLGVQTRCVVMPPGSSWSDTEGFRLREFDYAKKQEYIDHLLAKYSSTLSKQYEKEEQTVANFRAFEAYFNKFFKAIPFLLIGRKKIKVIFRIKERQDYQYWLVDFLNKKVHKLDLGEQEGEVASFTIDIHAVVINDCTRKLMFSVWGASKRLKIELPVNKNLADVNFLFSLLDLYENDCFPLGQNLTWRSISTRIRRWRDVVEFTKIMFKYKVLKKELRLADLYPVTNH